MESHEDELSVEGEIHGYHVYQTIWTPIIDTKNIHFLMF